MSIPELCIRRPVMTTLVMLGLLFFGVISYLHLPTSYLPSVDFPVIQVSASVPGASAETMASSVATPLEREFSEINGLAAMSSVNSQSSTTVTLEFDLNRDIDAAAMDVQAAISRAQGDLPDNMSAPPSYDKVNPADQPVLYLTLHSDTLPLSKVNEYAKTFLTESISMVEGVAKVIIYGEQKYAVRIQVDPDLLSAKGMGLDRVQEAVTASNVDLPLGLMDGRHQNLTLQADGQLMTAEPYNDVVVDYQDGQPVRLRALGQAVDGVEDDKTGTWLDGERVIAIAVKRQPGSNTIKVVGNIKDMLPDVRKNLPAGIDLKILYDKSVLIEESVDDVKFTLLLAVALVVMVVFLFLRSLTGTFIAAVAVPFSIVTTFAVMYMMGFTLDQLSLMALVLAVGFVVDDAIVMLENVVRHLEAGKKPMAAALAGAKEIGSTIISMTLSLSVVFIPIMFMGGTFGRILHEFAVTITAAILCSGVVSLTLTPMLSSRVLRGGSRIGKSGPIFGAVTAVYRFTLGLALKVRPLVILATIGILVATGYLFLQLPKGFLPSDDMNVLFGYVEGPQGMSWQSMVDHQLKYNPIMQQNPNVTHNLQVVGLGYDNKGVTVLTLKPTSQRKLSADQVVYQLQPKVSAVPGIMAYLQNPPMIPSGSKATTSPYQFTLQSPNTGNLFKDAAAFTQKLSQIPELTGVTNDLKIDNPQVEIEIDRDKAATLGVSAYAIENALYSAYGERRVSTINAANDEYKVIMEVLPRFQHQASDLHNIYITANDGSLVNLDVVANYKQDRGPLTVNHTGQLPSVTVSFNTAPGVSLSQATAKVQDLAKTVLSPDISTQFEGTADDFKSAMSTMPFLLLLTVVIIYIILGVLYESFIHPITILSGLPSAALGGLLVLYFFGLELNLYGMVGVIMLIGIVQKNGIMVVDFALEEEQKGETSREAALNAALIRFRPILMTTLAAIMGAMPIAVGYGAGGRARQPLGLAVVGGLAVSQLVTLFVVPVVYTYMSDLQRWLTREPKTDTTADAAVSGPTAA